MADETPDTSGMSPEDAAYIKKYGNVKPGQKKKGGAAARLQGGSTGRQFFDSADYSMQMAAVQNKIPGGGAGPAVTGAPVVVPGGATETVEEEAETA